MSIWTRIVDALTALRQGEPLSAVFDRLGTPPERSVAFTIAVIALAAKMAKADGLVTRNEVSAFREVFTIAPRDEAAAARVFNLARQDVAGFDAWAGRIARMFKPGSEVLADVLDGLFRIAVADGGFHPREEEFLFRVAGIFGLDGRCFQRIRARYVPGSEPDPYDVLGLPSDATLDEARAEWHRLVRETHPDVLIGRGVPEEALKMAEARLVALNRAWERIQSKEAA